MNASRSDGRRRWPRPAPAGTCRPGRERDRQERLTSDRPSSSECCHRAHSSRRPARCEFLASARGAIARWTGAAPHARGRAPSVPSRRRVSPARGTPTVHRLRAASGALRLVLPAGPYPVGIWPSSSVRPDCSHPAASAASASASSPTPRRSITSSCTSSIGCAAHGVTLGAIFGPQHGFRSDVQDNMIETPHGQDARRRVPVYSLYSETREPTPEMLDGLDVLVDRPAGRRHARLHLHLHDGQLPAGARRAHGVPVIVCDRPNPIGGVAVEGPMLQPRLRVVRRAVPDPAAPRHDDRRAGAALQRGVRASAPRSTWCRWTAGRARCIWDDDRAALGDAVAEHADARHRDRLSGRRCCSRARSSPKARGTTRPFELIGAPWIDGDAPRRRR